MCKRLWEIAQGLALRPCLFRIKPEVVGVAQHTFKQQPGFIQLFRGSHTRASERLYEPKRTHIESTLRSRKSVNAGLRRITIDEAVTDKTSMPRILEDGLYGAEHPWISRRHEKDQRHNKERRVQVFAAVKLGKRAAFLVPAFSHHFFVDSVPFAQPLSEVGGKCTLVGQPKTAIQSNPIHDFRIDEMLLAIAHLPYAGIRELPVVADLVKPIADLYPNVVGRGADVLVG